MLTHIFSQIHNAWADAAADAADGMGARANARAQERPRPYYAECILLARSFAHSRYQSSIASIVGNQRQISAGICNESRLA